MSRRKQGHARIASAAGQNRIAGLEDLEVVQRRLLVAEDLVRALSVRLLARHEELRQIRTAGRFKGLSAAVLLLLLLVAMPSAADKAKPSVVIRASSTITADENGTTQLALQISGGFILIDVTELGASQTLKLALQVKDPVSGVWRNAENSATAWNSTGLKIQAVGRHGVASSQIVAGDVFDMDLPYEWRFLYVLNNGTNATFSVALVPFPE